FLISYTAGGLIFDNQIWPETLLRRAIRLGWLDSGLSAKQGLVWC
ncbi:7532_t:CDS:1, partial [Cetraspora pellucida]